VTALLIATFAAAAWLNYRNHGAALTRFSRPNAARAENMVKYEDRSYNADLTLANRFKAFEGDEAAYEDAATQIAALQQSGQAVEVLPAQPVVPVPMHIAPRSQPRCLGTVQMGGYGPVSMVRAGANTPGEGVGQVDVLDTKLICHMKGRSYFGHSCYSQSFSNTEYVSLQLLGKTLRYTMDLSGAQCGCNAAFYLTSMAQNSEKSECSDFYCDANKVCGVSCAEIDIQEANSRAWASTLHTSDDGSGLGQGYGANFRQWSSKQYGPGGECIDTARPFQVAASFPTDADGNLRDLEVTLTQAGKSCPLTVNVGHYMPNGHNGMEELTQALVAGMTPVISYWGKDEKDMLWLDGQGGDGQGPCAVDAADTCGESVTFSEFTVEDMVSVSAWLK
jgi:hypothetical protein